MSVNSTMHETKEEAIEKATQLGLVCVFPEKGELLVDDDGDSAYAEDAKAHVLEILEDHGISLIGSLLTTSKSGKRHRYYRVSYDRDLYEMEKVVLQLLLGSDPAREAFSMIRIQHQSEAPTVLFEKPEEAVKVTAWRLRMSKSQGKTSTKAVNQSK